MGGNLPESNNFRVCRSLRLIFELSAGVTAVMPSVIGKPA